MIYGQKNTNRPMIVVVSLNCILTSLFLKLDMIISRWRLDQKGNGHTPIQG